MSEPVQYLENKVLAAARSLFDEAGAGFTLDQLEKRSQISRSTIYRRVGGKEALLEKLARLRGEPFTPADSRLQIIQAARNIFARMGLAGSTMEQIALEAGVGVATVYRHFGDKDSLVRAFIEEMSPRHTLRSLALNATGDIAGDLEAFIRPTLAFFFENRDLLRLVFMGGEHERRYLETLRQSSDTSIGHLSAYFQVQMEAGRIQSQAKAAELALSLLGMVLAFSLIGPLHYGTDLPDPVGSSRLLVHIFLENLTE